MSYGGGCNGSECGIADETIEFPEDEADNENDIQSIAEDEATVNAYFPFAPNNRNSSSSTSNSPSSSKSNSMNIVPSLQIESVSSVSTTSSPCSSPRAGGSTTARPLSTRSTGSSSSRPNSGRMTSRFMIKPFRCGSPTDRGVVSNPAEALKMKIKKSAATEIFEVSTGPYIGRR